MFFIPKEDLNYAVQGLSCHEEVFKNKTFLITGGTGFIGKWLLDPYAQRTLYVNLHCACYTAGSAG